MHHYVCMPVDWINCLLYVPFFFYLYLYIFRNFVFFLCLVLILCTDNVHVYCAIYEFKYCVWNNEKNIVLLKKKKQKKERKEKCTHDNGDGNNNSNIWLIKIIFSGFLFSSSIFVFLYIYINSIDCLIRLIFGHHLI